MSTASKANNTVQRAVEFTIKSTRFGPTNIPGKEHYRIIGTTDIDGKGTNHPLASLDPFVFWDESLNVPGVAGLGGGGHPHGGLTAITYLNPDRSSGGTSSSSEAGALQPWDNFDGSNQPVNNAGGIYAVACGRGIVHDERNITKTGIMHQFQLWVDPGHKTYRDCDAATQNNADDTDDTNLNLPKARATLYPPNDVPVAQGMKDLGENAGEEAWCRVMIGSQYGYTSPMESPVRGGMLYVHLSLPPSRSAIVTVPGGFRGIVLCVEGEALVGGNRSRLTQREAAVLSPDDESSSSKEMVVVNPSEGEEMQVLVAAGAPQYSGPLYKTLKHGGAIFASSEDAARACMKRFESDPDNFGK